MADDRIVIEIELDDGTIQKGFLNVEKAAQDAGKRAGEALDGPKSGLTSLAKGAGIAIAAFAGFKAITKTMGLLAKSIRDAAAEADAVQGLNTALALSGHYSKEASTQLQNFANDIERVTNFSGDAALGVATLIQNLGKLEPAQLERSTKAALDLATALRIDVNSAAQLVGKAAVGSTESLGRYGIQIQKTGNVARDFEAVLSKLEKSFGGASEAASKTVSGAFVQLQNSFGNMTKELGRLVTQSPAVVAVLNVISQTFTQIGKAIRDSVGGRDILKPLLSDLVTMSAFLVASFGPLLEATFRIGNALFNSIVMGAKTALTALTGVFGLIEMAINKLVGTDYQFFQTATKDLWDSTQQSANETADSFVDAFTRSGEATTTAMDFLAQLKGAIDSTNGSLINMADTGLKNVKSGMEEVKVDALTLSQVFDNVMKGMKESARDFADEAVKNMKQVGAQMFQSIGNAAGQAFAAFGRAVAKGENGLKAFLDSFLASMGQMAIQLGTQFILMGIAYSWAKMPNGPPLIAAGAALAAFGGVLSALGGGSGAVGGTGAQPVDNVNDNMLASPEDIESQKPTNQIHVNIQGDVLDSRDTGMRIVDLIKEYTDRNGRTEVFA